MEGYFQNEKFRRTPGFSAVATCCPVALLPRCPVALLPCCPVALLPPEVHMHREQTLIFISIDCFFRGPAFGSAIQTKLVIARAGVRPAGRIEIDTRRCVGRSVTDRVRGHQVNDPASVIDMQIKPVGKKIQRLVLLSRNAMAVTPIRRGVAYFIKKVYSLGANLNYD